MQRCLSASSPCSTDGLISDSPNHYHQRDMLPSHTYRVGVKIFGKTPAYRTRFIDTSLCQRRLHIVPHPIMSKRLQDLKVGATTSANMGTKLHETIRKTEKKSPSTFTTTEYRSWIESRQQLRTDLEKMGNTERWLSNKDCTPIETTLLTRLQTERKLAGRKIVPPTPVESSDSDDDELSPSELKRLQHLEKKALLRSIKKLQQFLIHGRVWLVGVLLPHSVADNDFLVTSDILFNSILQMRPPVEQEIVDIVCDVLEHETNVADRVHYQLIFKTDLVELTEKYWSARESAETLVSEKDNDDQTSDDGDAFTCSTVMTAPDSRHHQSTMMEGENGKLSEEFKQEALRQFNELIKYCTEHGIELNRNLAEGALLYPADKSHRECLSYLREPGYNLPLRKTFNPPLELEDTFSLSALQKIYGWQHKILRGPQPQKVVRLSTGRKRVAPKVDCWLTFKEFKDITEEIRSRPGFNYKYHGLPSNSAFWPGALRDKLRLHLPQETLETNPYSLYNIFQPVQHPKVYNPFTPQPITDGVWPENDRGYVQLGEMLARTKKSYCV